MPASSVFFSSVARLLAAEARLRGLAAPGFLSPPRSPAVNRSIRRFSSGGAVVAVRLRGRPVDDVVADMVEGVLAVNAVEPAERRDELRAELLAAVSVSASAADDPAADAA